MNREKPRLAILIPTLVGREHFLQNLLDILNPQLNAWRDRVAVIMNKDDYKKSIGKKRNELTRQAIDCGFTHRAFIDDDDTVSDNYLELNMPGVLGDYDCNSLVGIYTVNGVKNPDKHIFIHSLKYTYWYEDEKYYYRNPNHLNVCSLKKIGHIEFPESDFGEDGQWSEKVAAEGCLKNEYEITTPFYNYLARTKSDEEMEKLKAKNTLTEAQLASTSHSKKNAKEFHKRKYQNNGNNIQE